MSATFMRGAVALLLTALLLPARAADTPQPLPQAEALHWLERINTAANRRSYRGTMVVTANGTLSSSRVAHVCVGDQFVERVEALDGRQHRIYRHNEVVHTVWPQERVVVVEKGGGAAALALSTRRVVEPRALDSYTVRRQGTRRVAGRTAQVLLLEPRDDLRLAQRLWADDDTGLLLRTDLLGPSGAVLESAAFGAIEFGLRIKPEVLLQGMTPPGFRVEAAPDAFVDMHAEGWALRDEVPGFRLIGCLKRPLADVGESGDDLLQAVFSDGLTFVSIFIEPFDPERHSQALAAEMGATRTLMRREGAYWITAVGDVPQRALEAFLRALERRP